jgi:NACalpha-BTF3-like transcription factor
MMSTLIHNPTGPYADVMARTAEAERKAEEARLERYVTYMAPSNPQRVWLSVPNRRVRPSTPRHRVTSHCSAQRGGHLPPPRSEPRAKQTDRERALRAVKIAKEDVAVLEKEFELKTDVAERVLREAGGDVAAAIMRLIGVGAKKP